MAETLGRAWKDVNRHLEFRKQILDLNVLYHTKAQEFFERMDRLEASCADSVVPVEVEAVKTFLASIHDQRRALLESLMTALQAGNSLLGKLKELGAEGTLDSRPDRIRSSVNRGKSTSGVMLVAKLRISDERNARLSHSLPNILFPTTYNTVA